MRLALICLCWIVLCSSSQARDWKEELAADFVTVDSNKQRMDEFVLLKFKAVDGSDATSQIQVHSEGPVSAISRDNFVGITTLFYTLIIAEMAKHADFEIEDLDEPIGSVDAEINIYMTKAGVQIEVVDRNTNQKTKHTTKWEEVFGEK